MTNTATTCGHTLMTSRSRKFEKAHEMLDKLQRICEYIRVVWIKSERSLPRCGLILSEILLLRILNGLLPSYYLLGDFTRKDMSWADKREYFGPKEYEKSVWSINDSDYRKISQNKLPEKAILTAFGIPTPKLLGFFDAVAGYDTHGNPLRNGKDLNDLLSSILDDGESVSICFKLLEGWNGSGFQAVSVSKKDDKLLVNDLANAIKSETQTIDTFISNLGNSGYLIEEYIDQHPDYAKYHPQSINGYRFWVLQKNDSAEVVLAYMRFGCGEEITDNGSNYIRSPLDMETGRMSVAFQPSFERPLFTHHPDTNELIQDQILPFYDEAKQLAIKSLLIFPNLNFAGFDIAVSKNGPVVLELNCSPSAGGAHYCRKPLNEIFAHCD